MDSLDQPITGAPPRHGEEQFHYRALSRPAVVSAVLAALSLLAYFSSVLVVLPLVGIVVGVIGWSSIRKYPEELVGEKVALVAAAVNAVILLSAGTAHALTYAFEVPEGYTRVGFHELQPDNSRPELPIPPLALELDGQKIFVAGYVYPDGQQANIRQFVLVPDMGTCCFGGQPKLTDMIQVTLKDPLRTHYSYARRKLGGSFKVSTQLKPVSGVNGVYYQLEADYLK